MSISTLICLSLLFTTAYLYLGTQSTPMNSTPGYSRGYILTNKVTHARLFPVRHAFGYQTLAVLVSLEALEKRELDLRVGLGRTPGLVEYLNLNINLFRFGRTWFTVLGLRGDPYLGTAPNRNHKHECNTVSLRARLDRVLRDRGVITHPNEIRDVWMMTMPAICGFEGLNPLTVYFCYRPSGEVSVVVLEVHNTFGEGHVYVLQIDKNEDPSPARGYLPPFPPFPFSPAVTHPRTLARTDHRYDHQWTFPRPFFVSPFNDRSGFYTVSITLPSHPPFDLPQSSTSNHESDPPKASVRVHLHVPSSTCPTPTPLAAPIDQSNVGPLKLVAHITPKSAVPLTRGNLITTLARFPLALFITLPRILYHACILHYSKRLPIFGRPEPHPRRSPPPASFTSQPDSQSPTNDDPHLDHPGGIISQPPSLFDRYARHRTQTFLRERCPHLTMSITLVPGDPAEEPWSLRVKPRTSESDPDSHPHLQTPTLTIEYTSPRFFTLFLLAPNARTFFRAGCKARTDGERRVFRVSDEGMFTRLFDPRADRDSNPSPTANANANPEGEGTEHMNGASKLEERGSIERLTQRIRLSVLPRDVQGFLSEDTDLDSDLRTHQHPLTSIRTPFKTQVLDLLVVGTLVLMDRVQEWVFWVLRVRFVEGTEPWVRDVWRRGVSASLRVGGGTEDCS